MPGIPVPIENAIPIRRAKGSQVTMVNQNAVGDIYVDADPNRLNAGAVGAMTIANGTKIAAAGGQIQWDSYPGLLWARAATVAVSLEVNP